MPSAALIWDRAGPQTRYLTVLTGVRQPGTNRTVPSGSLAATSKGYAEQLCEQQHFFFVLRQ
jgi:hypothetical protein